MRVTLRRGQVYLAGRDLAFAPRGTLVEVLSSRLAGREWRVRLRELEPRLSLSPLFPRPAEHEIELGVLEALKTEGGLRLRRQA